jgi:hypothetical protein
MSDMWTEIISGGERLTKDGSQLMNLLEAKSQIGDLKQRARELKASRDNDYLYDSIIAFLDRQIGKLE